MLVVSFGDKPAGAIASLSIRKTALNHENTHPRAYNTLTRNIYVDDILDSTDYIKEAIILSMEVDQVLNQGGFSTKKWTISSQGNGDIEKSFLSKKVVEREESMEVSIGEEDESPMTSVLGMIWNVKEDVLIFKVKLNFSPKRNNKRTEPDIAEKDINVKFPKELTRKDIISQVNGFFDPEGLATPVTVGAKILVRKLWIGDMKQMNWDDSIPEDYRLEWKQFFKLLYKMETVRFHRAPKPKNIGEEEPILVIFSDASEHAYGMCCYVRWKMTDGSYKSQLLTAKNKIAPLKKLSIVRLELNAAVMAARVQEFITRESRFKFTKIYYIIDSEIVLATLQKDSYIFRTFVGSRVNEIQTTTDLSRWFWIDGATNIADWVTKPRSPDHIGENSVWQRGPKFMEKPEEEWPIK